MNSSLIWSSTNQCQIGPQLISKHYCHSSGKKALTLGLLFVAVAGAAADAAFLCSLLLDPFFCTRTNNYQLRTVRTSLLQKLQRQPFMNRAKTQQRHHPKPSLIFTMQETIGFFFLDSKIKKKNQSGLQPVATMASRARWKRTLKACGFEQETA